MFRRHTAGLPGGSGRIYATGGTQGTKASQHMAANEISGRQPRGIVARNSTHIGQRADNKTPPTTLIHLYLRRPVAPFCVKSPDTMTCILPNTLCSRPVFRPVITSTLAISDGPSNPISSITTNPVPHSFHDCLFRRNGSEGALPAAGGPCVL